MTEVDGAHVRLQLPQEILRSVALQIDWTAASMGFVKRVAVHEGLLVPDLDVPDFFVARLAELNDMDEAELSTTLKRQVRNRIKANRALVRDVCVALSELCLAMLRPPADGDETRYCVTQWLTSGAIGLWSLRRVGIFHRVGRQNARGVLRSVLTWLGEWYRPGTLVLIDARQLTKVSRANDTELRYSRLALLDAYEVLREFIDDSSQLHHTLLIVAAADEFLELAPTSRGLGAYDALRYRVYDEVRTSVANPSSVLVQVAERSGARRRDAR
jgi:hypothetical protein